MWDVVIPASGLMQQQLLGVSALSRQIMAAAEAGATRIYITASVAHANWLPLFSRTAFDPALVQQLGDASLPEAKGKRLHLSGKYLVQPDRLKDMLQKGAEEGGLALDDIQIAERALLVGTGKASDGYISRWINRPISQAITRQVLGLGLVSPMVFTALTAFVGILMLVAFVALPVYGLLLGCLLFQLASILDGVDGEIARLTWQSSRFGAALDTGVDMTINMAFLIGLFIALGARGEPHIWAMATAVVSCMATGIILMLVLLRLGPGGGSFDILPRALAIRLRNKPKLKSIVLKLEPFFKRDWYAFYCCMAGLFGIFTAIPIGMLFGVVIWLLAILYCAPVILADAHGELRPAHDKAESKRN
jgi:phosphatidylglycerophosphate synthase